MPKSKDSVMLIIPNLTVEICFSPSTSSLNQMELVGVLLHTLGTLDMFHICCISSRECVHGDSHKHCG